MPTFVNGPTNFAYLKGTINGITKNIYLFMDNHYPLNEQTRCESFDSIDISQYLYKLIKNTKEPLDFFTEIRLHDINLPTTNKRDIYIKEVDEMFKSEFIVEKNNDNNNETVSVKHSKTNPYVRLHYLDVRDHFDLFYIIDIINFDIPETFDLIYKNIGNTKDHLKKILKYIKKIEFLLDRFYKNIKDILIVPDEKYNKIEKQKYYLNKIINKYKNNELKENINNFIDIHVNHLLFILTKYIDELKPFFENYNEKYNDKIKEYKQHIYNSSIDIYSLLTNAYLLRRILDKDYITNCVVYSSAQHSVNYMYFLLNYCNFELINIYRSIEKDKNTLVKLIKKAQYVFDIYKLIYLTEKKYLQCLKFNGTYFGKNRTNLFEYPDFDKLYPSK